MTMRTRRVRGLLRLAWSMLPMIAGCGAVPATVSSDDAPRFVAAPWPQADRLFRGDAYWVGADGAYSVPLGAGRTLWLFGDTVIDPTGAGSRRSTGATMVSNTLAIQQGDDPSDARMTFFWGSDQDGAPDAFLPDGAAHRFWPGHGIRLRDRLVLFFMRVRSTTGGLGFEVYDWSAVMVRNPDDLPSRWIITTLMRPPNDFQVIVGSAAVLAWDGFVYAFSSREPSGGDAYLVRWPEARVYDGDLGRAQWWSAGGRWTEDGSAHHEPVPVLKRAGTEFTVHHDARSGRFLQVQATGFGAADLEVRWAHDLTGPWSEPVVLYRPPEHDRPRIMIYQGKAHPQLRGGDLVLTYSTNSFDFETLLDDDRIYVPRFVRLTREAD